MYNRENLWLIQIYGHQGISGRLFVVFSTGEKDAPFISAGKIIIYSEDQIIKNFFSVQEVGNMDFLLEQHLDFIYDAEKLIKLIEIYDEDCAGYILDCLNLLFDAVSALHVAIPNSNVELLEGLANHLTFNHDISGYLKRYNIAHKDILDALYWCHKIVLINSCKVV